MPSLMAYAMIDKGITPPPIELVYDGTIQRFKKEGDDKSNSWYVGYRNGGFETGAFGCWKLGVNETFCSKEVSDFTPAEKKDYAIKQSEMRKLQEVNTTAKNQEAETSVNDRWSSGNLVDSHQYLSDKGVISYDLRVDRGSLLVPLFNIEGEMLNIQSINPNGDKYFAKGAKKKGCFYLLGEVTDTIIFCEGYSTGASIFEATKIAVAICFDAGNLMSVALDLSTKHPNAKILICGDDDRHNEVNTGRIKACETATHVGGSVVFPVFEDNVKDNPTDFNDLHKLRGLSEVKKQIYIAIHDSMGVKRKDNVLIYASFYEAMKECDDDIQIKVFQAVMDYGLYNKHTQLSGIAKSLFIIMKPLIDSNVKKYNDAKKGGRKPKKD
jgi:putative DNA primase/helicase